MKLPYWSDTASSTTPLHVRSLAPRPPVDGSPRLAFLARMAVYSRSLSAAPLASSTPVAGGSSSSTSISSNNVIGGAVGAGVVLLICLGVFVAVRIRYRKRVGLWTNSTTGTSTANSQKTLCNPEGGFVITKTRQAGVMKGTASFSSEHSQEGSMQSAKGKPVPLESIAMRTHGKRPTIGIDTSQLPAKIRRSLADSHMCFLQQKRGQQETERGTPIEPMGECNLGGETPTNRTSMRSTYTLSLQLSRPSTSLSRASMQTVSPITFCDAPSNSHLPLAPRPKAVTSRPEEGQSEVDNTNDPTSLRSTST